MNKRKSRDWPRAIFVVVLALQILRGLVYPWTADPKDLGPDGQIYVDWANAISHQNFPYPGLTHFSSTALFCLVLSGLFKIVGPSILAVRLFNFLVWLGLLGLSFLLARRVFNRSVAMISTATLALDSPFFFIKYAQYELLLTILCLAGIWFLISAWEESRLWCAAMAGACFGLATLTQGKALPMPILMFLALLCGSMASWKEALCRTLRLGATLGLVTFLVLIPWSYRNFVLTGEWILTSSNGGVTFFIGNNPEAIGTIHYPDPKIFYAPPNLTPKEMDRYYYAKGLAFIRSSPMHFAFVLVPLKLCYLFDLWKPRNVLLLALAILGIGRCKRTLREPGPLIFLSSILYITVLHAAYYGWERYRFPCLPFLHMFAAVFLVEILDRWRTGRDPQMKSLSSDVIASTAN